MIKITPMDLRASAATGGRSRAGRRRWLRAGRSWLTALLVAAAVVATPPALAAEDPLAAAQQAIAEGSLQRAIDVLEPLIREEPDNAEARFLRGVVFAQMGETDRAIAIFSALTERYPDLSEPHNNLAVLYAAKGSLEKAREELIKATTLQPDYHTAFENLGDVYAKLAAEAYQRAYHLEARNERARRKYDVLSGLLDAPPRPAAGGPDSLAATGVREDPPQPRAAARAAEADCHAMGPMDAATLERITAWLSEQQIAFRSYARERRTPRAHQVYLETDGDPGAVRERLRREGITDVALVTTGPLAGKLSLGVYRQEESVTRRLRQLETLGHDARTLTLYHEATEHWLVIEGRGFDPLAFGRVFGHQAPRPVDCAWRPAGAG